MKQYKRYVLFPLILLILSCNGISFNPQKKDVWPEETWRRSTPEEQGIDSAVLLDLLKEMNLADGINSMVIIRNGSIIAEFYKEPFSSSSTQPIYGCTIGFTSALIGIAIDEKLINNVNQPVLSLFQEVDHTDPKAEDITIEDLLTMRSGFEWNRNPNLRYDYFLSKPMNDIAGTVFQYNPINSQLLVEIIHRVSGMQTDMYAKEKLLDPIGIDSWTWKKTPEDGVYGTSTLSMTTEDLSRIGYLYLHKGVWNGDQIISKKWVRKSTKSHSSAKIEIPPNRVYPIPYFGYHWWVWNRDIFVASGYKGQLCVVDKKKNMVIAFSSNAEESQQRNIYKFVFNRMASMDMKDSPLAENQEALYMLQKYLSLSAKDPVITSYTDQDLWIDQIHEKVIFFDENEMGLQKLRFTFINGRVICSLIVSSLVRNFHFRNHRNFHLGSLF